MAGPSNVKSVQKAFAVLEAFRQRDGHFGLTEIVRATGLDKSAVQSLARTLCEGGYLEQDPETRYYRLGIRLLDLSYAYLRSHPLIERAAPILVDLRRTSGERVDLTLRDGQDLVFVFRLQSKRETLQAALVGRRVPLFCSAGGRAILAAMQPGQARNIVYSAELRPFTPRTITDPERILEEVGRARERGFAFQDQEWRLGEVVVAAAVLDRDGMPVGAVHIAGSTAEWDPAQFAGRMGPLVAAAAQDIRG